MLIDLNIAYDHHDATTLIDKLGAFMYQSALEKSISLAKAK